MNCPARPKGGGYKIILTAALITIYGAILASQCHATTTSDLLDHEKIPESKLPEEPGRTSKRGLSLYGLHKIHRQETRQQQQDKRDDRKLHNLTYCENQDMHSLHWKYPVPAHFRRACNFGATGQLIFDSPSIRPDQEPTTNPIPAKAKKNSKPQSDERLPPNRNQNHPLHNPNQTNRVPHEANSAYTDKAHWASKTSYRQRQQRNNQEEPNPDTTYDKSHRDYNRNKAKGAYTDKTHWASNHPPSTLTTHPRTHPPTHPQRDYPNERQATTAH